MQTRIEKLKKAFDITDETFQEREEVAEYISSFALLIIDRFYEKFLLNSLYKEHISIIELPRLKRMRTDLIVSLFEDKFDEKLLNKIVRSCFDAPFKIDTQTVLFAFETLQESIIEISFVNENIKNRFSVILKFLNIAQYVILDEIIKNMQKNKFENQVTIIDVFEIFYEMLTFYKVKHKKFILFFETSNSDKIPLDLVIDDEKECSFYEFLKKAKVYLENNELFKIIKNLEDLHVKYHQNLKKFYNSKTKEEKEDFLKDVESIYQQLLEQLSKPFEESTSLTFLSIHSGLKFIQIFNDAINEFNYVSLYNEEKTVTFLQQLIQNSIEHSLKWIIADFKVATYNCSNNKFISHSVSLSKYTLYFCFSIKDVPYKSFIIDIINVFLKIIQATLIAKEREQKLISLADRAESANKAKDMFLANMSHELRTPLNAIIGFSQILQTKQEIPDNLKTYIEKISISGKNLLNLVNTILDFAKIEAGKISYHPKMTMIIDVIREVEAIVSTLAQNKNITLEFPGDISVAMYIDEQLIKQVLINLFSNAIKFTPKGGKVSMRINFKKEQEEYIISVCDTGVGISKENIYKLFTPFTQIDNELQPSTKGSGLGLVISKKIIEDLHEGRIWVESEEGKGSCFYIALPISHENGIVEIFPSLNKNSEKILIVEDSEEYASLLVKKLNKVFDITLTNSVEKAKELLNTKKFDVIVLDFFLVDGVSSEIIDFMEEQNIEIPIFVISAEDDIKLITYLGESNNIVGVFNKNNTELICDTILRRQND